MTPTAYRLRQPVTAKRPTRWDIQMRYAMRLPDKTVDLPAGTWLLALPEAEGGRPGPPHYRLGRWRHHLPGRAADGRTGGAADRHLEDLELSLSIAEANEQLI